MLHIWIPLEPNYADAPEMQFTRRERQVLDGILAAKANKEIAFDLCITERAVKFHVSNLFQKTHCANRVELAQKFSGMTNTSTQ